MVSHDDHGYALMKVEYADGLTIEYTEDEYANLERIKASRDFPEERPICRSKKLVSESQLLMARICKDLWSL